MFENTGALGRLRRFAPYAALGAMLAMLFGGLLVPVYTDEIGWRFQERAAIDGLDIMFNDLCGPHTLAHPPWFMMPVRIFSATANQALASPLFVRIAGLACALAWTGLLWLLTARLESDKAARARLRAVLFSLLALGVLPFLMVFSRPEQPVILMLILSVLTALVRTPKVAPGSLAAIKVLAIVVFGWIAISYHLKGVAYSPVFFACLAACASGRQTIMHRLAGGVVLGALTVAATIYWSHRFQCPGDPQLAAKLGTENVAVILTGGGNLMELAVEMAKGLLPTNYIWLALPMNRNTWMPNGMFADSQMLVIAIMMTLMWVGIIAWSLFELGQYLVANRLRALAEPRALLALAVLGCLAVWGASQLNRNVYEASHYLPMAVLFCALCLSLPRTDRDRRERALSLAGRFGVPAAVASAALVLFSTMGPLAKVAGHPGWIPELRVSVSPYDYGQVRRDIALAMDRAGMGGSRQFNRLLLDDVTYMALQHHTFPMHRLGVLGDWRGAIADPVDYLRSRNSDGVVVGCRYLPPRMRTVAGRAGEVCAISREGLDRLAAGGPTRFGEGEEF